MQTAIAIAQTKVKAKRANAKDLSTSELHDAKLSEAQRTVQTKLRKLEEAAKHAGAARHTTMRDNIGEQVVGSSCSQMYKTAEQFEYDHLYRQLERYPLNSSFSLVNSSRNLQYLYIYVFPILQEEDTDTEEAG